MYCKHADNHSYMLLPFAIGFAAAWVGQGNALPQRAIRQSFLMLCLREFHNE